MALIQNIDFGYFRPALERKCEKIGCNWWAEMWAWARLPQQGDTYRRLCVPCWNDASKEETWR